MEDQQKSKHSWTKEEMVVWHFWTMEWFVKDLKGETYEDVTEGAIIEQRYIFTPDYVKNKKA